MKKTTLWRTKPGNGVPRLPDLTPTELKYLKDTLPKKSPQSMKLDSSEYVGHWMPVDVQLLLMKKFNKKVSLANCTIAIRKTGLVPISQYASAAPTSNPHKEWKNNLSKEFKKWLSLPSTKSLKRKDTSLKKRYSKHKKPKLGASTLIDREHAENRKKYILGDPLLKKYNKLSNALAEIAEQHG